MQQSIIDVSGNNTEAQEFLSRGGQVIIRMRGLPYDCTAKQVVSWNNYWLINILIYYVQIEFFNNGDQPCDVLDEEGGVLFVKKPDGRATGDAFVLFKEENEGEIALLKHKEIIGSRYIELFRSTTAEVQQVRSEISNHFNWNIFSRFSIAPRSSPSQCTVSPVPQLQPSLRSSLVCPRAWPRSLWYPSNWSLLEPGKIVSDSGVSHTRLRWSTSSSSWATTPKILSTRESTWSSMLK